MTDAELLRESFDDELLAEAKALADQVRAGRDSSE